jgi:TRAP-type C4-dicarboxylate transport system substrate-binding protein
VRWLKDSHSGGGALDAMVRGADAVPVRISSPELHEALARGTIDGLLFPFGVSSPMTLRRF